MAAGTIDADGVFFDTFECRKLTRFSHSILLH